MKIAWYDMFCSEDRNDKFLKSMRKTCSVYLSETMSFSLLPYEKTSCCTRYSLCILVYYTVSCRCHGVGSDSEGLRGREINIPSRYSHGTLWEKMPPGCRGSRHVWT